MGVSNFADATTLPAASGAPLAPTASSAPAPLIPGDTMLVAFNGAYLPGSNPLDVYGNAWFEKTAREAGGSIKPVFPPDQVTYNYDTVSRNAALYVLLDTLDVNHNLVITAEEAAAANVVVMGYSWGAITAGNFTRRLRDDFIPFPGDENYALQADIPVKLLLMIDPVHSPVTQVIHQMSGKIETNVQRFVNFYQRRGGETTFDLWLGGSTGNGTNFSPFTKVGSENRLAVLDFDGPLKGRPIKYNVPAANVVQINVSNEGQRYASNVEYFIEPLEPDPCTSGNYFDADLKASAVEHNSIVWYVRGGLDPSFDGELNVLREIDDA